LYIYQRITNPVNRFPKPIQNPGWTACFFLSVLCVDTAGFLWFPERIYHGVFMAESTREQTYETEIHRSEK
jgi:hypothetical protein